jgi:hypothetical protein
MNISLLDQRQGVRSNSAYAIRIKDMDGRVLGKGRTANVSENGLLVLVDTPEDMEVGQQVLLDMVLPGVTGATRHDVARTVTYQARVANVRYIGHMLGMGLELVKKVRKVG